jgi:hypothetical protein
MNQSNQTSSLILIDMSFDPKTLVDFSYMNIVYMAIPAIVSLPCLFNILVFAHPNLTDPSFKILLTIAIADFLYLTLGLFSFVIDINCQPMPFMCGSSVQYFTYLFDYLYTYYLSNCLSLFSILAEIFLTTERLLLIRNSKKSNKYSVKIVSSVLAFISLVVYLPSLFCYNLIFTGVAYLYRNVYYVEYFLAPSDFSYTTAGTWLMSSLNFVRISLVMVVLSILNVICVVSFQRYFTQRIEKVHIATRPSK